MPLLIYTLSFFFLQVSKHHQAVFSQSWWCDCDVWNNLSGKFHSCQTVADKCQGKTVINSAGGTCRCYFVCFLSDFSSGSNINYKATIFVWRNKENIVHFYDYFKKKSSFLRCVLIFFLFFLSFAGKCRRGPTHHASGKQNRQREWERSSEGSGWKTSQGLLFFFQINSLSVGFYKWMEPTKLGITCELLKKYFLVLLRVERTTWAHGVISFIELCSFLNISSDFIFLKNCQMTFYECSACSGCNVMESMVSMARWVKVL